MRCPTPLRFTLLIAACVGAGLPNAWPLAVTTPPTLTMNPTGYSPLAGRVDLTTDVPARVTLTVTGGGQAWAVLSPTYETTHAVPVFGLKPGRAYTVRVAVTDQAGIRLAVDPPLNAVTGPLPAEFPARRLLASNPLLMEPGFTLLDRFTREGGGEGQTYSFIVNAAGEVVWYAPRGAGAMEQLPNGNIRYRAGEEVVEADLLGNLVSRIQLANPGQGLHHELFVSANGTYMALSKETTFVDNYPTSLTDPDAPTQTAPVEDDPVVEFAADGSLLNVWPLVDLIDPTRVGYDGLSLGRLGYDWVHANAVIDSPADDSLLVSLRHQDAIVKFSRAGEVKWILAPHQNWSAAFVPLLLTPIGTPFSWSYHQHAPMWTPSGTLLLFDNGNDRASPFDGTAPMADEVSYSRAVEYAIDDAQKTIRQVWEYRPTGAEQLYSWSRGDADWLPTTGNVLITYSDVAFVGGSTSCHLGLGGQHVRVQEVDHGAPAKKLFELVIYDSRGLAGECPTIKIYRSERIPSLYAATTTVLDAPEVSLAPARSQVKRGGTLSYAATTTNNAGTRQCYDAWTYVTLPNGRRFPATGELDGPTQECVDPHASVTRKIHHTIPPNAPLGTYTYSTLVGSYPLALSEASFTFQVIP